MFQAPMNMYYFSSAPVSKNRVNKWERYFYVNSFFFWELIVSYGTVFILWFIVDVLRLEQDQQGYFINFPGRTMPIPLEMSVSDA